MRALRSVGYAEAAVRIAAQLLELVEGCSGGGGGCLEGLCGSRVVLTGSPESGSSPAAVELVEAAMDGRYWAVPVGGVRVNCLYFTGCFICVLGVFYAAFHCGASLLFLALFLWCSFCDGIYSFLHSIVAFVGDT